MTQTVGNVGALVASSPLALAVEAVGWRAAFVTIGAATLLLALIALVLVRDRPEAAGLEPIESGRRERAQSLAEVVTSIPEVVTNARSWPPLLAAAGVYATIATLLGLWGVPYLTQVYGLGRIDAANTTAWLAMGIVIGAPLIGWLSDRRLGLRKLPLVVCTALYAACWTALLLPGDLRPPVVMLGPLFFVMGLPRRSASSSVSATRPSFSRLGCSSGFWAPSSTRAGRGWTRPARGSIQKGAIGGHSAYVWQ